MNGKVSKNWYLNEKVSKNDIWMKSWYKNEKVSKKWYLNEKVSKILKLIDWHTRLFWEIHDAKWHAINFWH